MAYEDFGRLFFEVANVMDIDVMEILRLAEEGPDAMAASFVLEHETRGEGRVSPEAASAIASVFREAARIADDNRRVADFAKERGREGKTRGRKAPTPRDWEALAALLGKKPTAHHEYLFREFYEDASTGEEDDEAETEGEDGEFDDEDEAGWEEEKEDDADDAR